MLKRIIHFAQDCRSAGTNLPTEEIIISPQLLTLEREVISSFLSSSFLMSMVRVIISQAIKLTQFTIHFV